MITFKEYLIKDQVNFQLENNLSLCENTFRIGTDNWKLYWSYLKENIETLDLNDFDKDLLQTDIGLTGIFEDQEVLLDYPYVDNIINEEKDVELNSPKRGGSKKFYVYVKNEKGNIIKVQFGDTTGLKAKINDPEARASFIARHQCDQKNDKTTPGYWSCRLPWYAKQLGLEGGGKFFW
jgi:hypothetical protein